jgi:uncharacterized phage protein gp47/JayE
MARFTPKRYEQILPQMIAKVVARSTLSDIADSSPVKHTLAAASRQDDEQYRQMSLLKNLFSIDSCVDEDLDDRAKEIQPGTITRIQEQKAVTTVTFSRNVAGASTVVVPIGTRVKTSDGIIFETTAEATITPTSVEQISGHGVGRDAPPVAATAIAAGSAGNVEATTLTLFEGGKPTGVDAATNQAKAQYGYDKETNSAFRQRIKDFVASLARTTVDALGVAVIGTIDALTGATVWFSSGYEDIVNRGEVIVYIDDGTGTAESYTTVVGESVIVAVGGEERFYLDNKPVRDASSHAITSSTRGLLARNTDYVIDPASGQINSIPALVAAEVITADYTYYDGLIQEAQKVIDGDKADRLNYPGYRSGGVRVTVQTPQILIQTVLANLTVLEGYIRADVVTAAKQATKDYINNLPISGDVIRHELVQQIMAVPGVYDVDLVTPAANTIILDDQMARTTDGNITVN